MCALTSTGTVLAWGYNTDGELGDGNTTNSTVPVAVSLPAGTIVTGLGSERLSGLATTQAGCLASTPSAVIWNYSTATSGSSHTLTTPLTVAGSGQANNPLTVTFTNDASMTAAAPAACANTYFSMPSLIGVTASGGAATATVSPATDAWTS